MGDFYTEQLVKRQKASSTTLIKAILIILTVLSVVLIFMIPFGIIGPVIMIALDVFLFRSMDVEYESNHAIGQCWYESVGLRYIF